MLANSMSKHGTLYGLGLGLSQDSNVVQETLRIEVGMISVHASI